MRPSAAGLPILLIATYASVASAQDVLRVRIDVQEGVTASRVEGHLADLDVVIDYADLACDAPLEARITYAEPGVHVLACVRQTPRAVTVEVIDVRARRAFVRRFGGGSPSARAEEAAVALRSTLDALRLGGELGIALPPARAPVAVAPDEREAVEADASAPDASDGDDPSLHVVLGAASTADGFEAGFPIAPSAQLGYARARFEVFAVGSVGLERRRAFDVATVLLTRHVAIIAAGYAIVDAPCARLVAAGGFGLAIRRRTTASFGEGFASTPTSRTLDALGYAGLRLSLFPRARGAFGFALGAGVEAPFTRARLVAQRGDLRTSLDEAYPVLPRFELGILVRTRP